MCGIVTSCLVYEHENAVTVCVYLSDMQPAQFCLFNFYVSRSENGSDVAINGCMYCTHAL